MPQNCVFLSKRTNNETWPKVLNSKSHWKSESPGQNTKQTFQFGNFYCLLMPFRGLSTMDDATVWSYFCIILARLLKQGIQSSLWSNIYVRHFNLTSMHPIWEGRIPQRNYLPHNPVHLSCLCVSSVFCFCCMSTLSVFFFFYKTEQIQCVIKKDLIKLVTQDSDICLV